MAPSRGQHQEGIQTRSGTTKTGLTFKKRYFAGQWEDACKAAGITDLHFHDIRGTTVTMLAEAGCKAKSPLSVGALGGIRTPDPQIRSLVLYPAELRALN